LGALLTRLTADAGARVLAISRRPRSLEAARAFGAAEAIPMDDHWRIIEQVKALTGGRFCDVVIEAVGKQWPLDLAAELAAWRGLDVNNAHERDPAVYLEGMQAAVDAVASGKLDPSPLYTHTFPLEELAEALSATRDRPGAFMKALVTLGDAR